MSRRHLITCVTFVLAAVGGLAATSVWESKPFNTWTDAELQSLLTASPWAGPGSMSRVTREGNLARTRGTVLVSWTTALPMRQAVARERIGFNGPITGEVEAFLAAPIDAFIIAVKVTGIPEAASFASEAGRAQLNTSLEPRDKAPIGALRGEGHLLDAAGKLLDGAPASGAGGAAGQATGGGALLVFAFPRDTRITVHDREVVFATRIGEFTIDRTFHVNDMVYKGKLEL